MLKKYSWAVFFILLLIFGFFLFDFNHSTKSLNQEQTIFTPAPELNSTPPSLWREFYHLDFTGLDLHPQQIKYDPLGQQIAIFDPEQTALVVLNLQKKNFTLIPWPATPVSALTWSAGELYLYSQAIYHYQVTKQQWQMISPYFDFTSSIDELIKFGDNFYLLGRQLLRKATYNQKKEYLGLESWFKDEESVSTFTPQDALIDGHIMIVNEQGQLKRYLRGDLTNWQVKDLSAFGPSYIWASPQCYYWLIPAQKSLYQLDQRGQILAQYEDEILEQAQFLWFDEEKQIFYTLIKQSIYAFSPATIEEKFNLPSV